MSCLRARAQAHSSVPSFASTTTSSRHCDCVYYHGWHRTTPIRPGKEVLAGVAPGTSLDSRRNDDTASRHDKGLQSESHTQGNARPLQQAIGAGHGDQARTAPHHRQPNDDLATPTPASAQRGMGMTRGLPFDEESKLVYGIIFSLRNMVKKLSTREWVELWSSAIRYRCRMHDVPWSTMAFDTTCSCRSSPLSPLAATPRSTTVQTIRNLHSPALRLLAFSHRDEAFIAYKTSTYKVHLFETPSGLKFVLFSDPSVESLRFILKSIYQTAYIEFVVRNPLVGMDSRTTKRGIDNQAFRTA